MSGVFQIDRAIFDNSIWNNVTEFRVFFYIVGNAVWKEEGVKVGNIHIKRGQYLRSYRNLREDLMYIENNKIKYYGIATIKRTIDKLVADGRLEKEETELGTLFTVVNYSLYQGFDRFNIDSLERGWNADGTAVEQQWNKKKKDNKDNNNIYTLVINYLNEKANKNFKPTTKKTQSLINARIKEGFSLDDFKKVIDIKCSQWLGTEMEKYLRPETLFGTKFEGYLNEKVNSNKTKEQSNWRGSDKRL